METVALILGIIGTVLGLWGAVLSTWQFLHERAKSKVKLSLVVQGAVSAREPDVELLSLRVTNLSAFDVTLAEAGLIADGGKTKVICIHVQGKFPKKLEPRTSFSIDFPSHFLSEAPSKTATGAFIRTQCGTYVETGAKEIPEMVEHARKNAVGKNKLRIAMERIDAEGKR